MSGGYDLQLVIKGQTFQEIALSGKTARRWTMCRRPSPLISVLRTWCEERGGCIRMKKLMKESARCCDGL